MAFDLVAEFRKIAVPLGQVMYPDYNTHPRQVLREASRLFAVLGNSFLMAVNQAGRNLDRCFAAVEAYNEKLSGPPNTQRYLGHYQTVATFRELVGESLARAASCIPADLRWKNTDGTEYDFRMLTSRENAAPQDSSDTRTGTA